VPNRQSAARQNMMRRRSIEIIGSHHVISELPRSVVRTLYGSPNTGIVLAVCRLPDGGSSTKHIEPYGTGAVFLAVATKGI
jgi:hypothetical protein